MSIKHDNFSIVPEMLFMLFWTLGLIKDLSFKFLATIGQCEKDIFPEPYRCGVS